MRHHYFGKKLNRNTNERRRLFAGLMRDLITRGSVVTNVAKAKAVAPQMEKLITKAKLGTDQKRREVSAVLTDAGIVKKLWEDGATRFAGRTSGFTRIVKLGMRRGDASEMAKIVFVDAPIVAPEVVKPVEEPSLAKAKRVSKVKKAK